MKRLLSYGAITCFLLFFSCEDKDANPDLGFIRAKIDGIETVYKTPPAEQDSYNYIRPGSINIRFNKDETSSQYFSINIIYGNIEQDVEDLQLPFVIKGPNSDFSGESPEALAIIVDPDGSPYGKQLAAGSSFEHEFTLTITAINDNLVKGTFSGIGNGKFENGEFSAALPMKDW